MAAFSARHGAGRRRWFDKTPQNVYGLFLLAAEYPDAQFVHIHRNPLNVVTSLYLGRTMKATSIVGGINYWMDTMRLIDMFKRVAPERLFELSYEGTTQEPQSEVRRLLNWLGEDPDVEIETGKIHPEQNLYRSTLTPEQVGEVERLCQPYMEQYGYTRATDIGDAAA